MKKILHLLTLTFLLSTSSLFAQQTGSFDETITFNSADRTLSCFVPKDYDSTKSYQLIIALHGSRDESSNYRRALIRTRKWDELFENTILVCPDGGEDDASDFYEPKGDEAIIEASIQFAIDHYNISENDILLAGFSLGGRSALKYGLDHPERFKGLLLNAPAIQGLNDLNNGPGVVLPGGFAYERANEVPIYMTIGSEDFTYVGIFEQLEQRLVKNNAWLQTLVIDGMGHSVPNASILEGIPLFFDNPAVQGLDADLFGIEPVIQYCDGEASPVCVVRNTGTDVIQSISFNYILDGIERSYQWTGSLASYEHAMVTLPSIMGADGDRPFSASIVSVNGVEDVDDDNNEIEDDLLMASEGKPLPYTENFSAADSWKSEVTGNLFTWYHETVGSIDNGSMNSLNNILFFNLLGVQEHIYSPVLDLSSSPAPGMAFDLSFNYHKYTPPFTLEDVVFADTLIVSISTDCGSTFTELFKKGGSELATFDQPIENPLSVEAGVFTPTEGDWETIFVDLQDFKDEKKAVVRFTYQSGMGGCIYLDNARFDEALSVVPKAETDDLNFSVFPNPAAHQVNISIENSEVHKVRLLDVSGRVLLETSVVGMATLSLDDYPNGYYQVEISEVGSHQLSRKPLIISK